MRSLLLIVCCIGVAIGTIPISVVRSFSDLAQSYNSLAVWTHAIRIFDEENKEWDLLLSHRISIKPESTGEELRERLALLDNSAKQVNEVLVKLRDAEVAIQAEEKDKLEAALSAWEQLLRRVNAFSTSLNSPKSVPPGRPGPPPTTPTPGDTEKSDIDSEFDHSQLSTTPI